MSPSHAESGKAGLIELWQMQKQLPPSLVLLYKHCYWRKEPLPCAWHLEKPPRKSPILILLKYFAIIIIIMGFPCRSSMPWFNNALIIYSLLLHNLNLLFADFLFTNTHYSPIFFIYPLSSLPVFSIISPHCQFINYITETHSWRAQFVPDAWILTAWFILKFYGEFKAMELLEKNKNSGNLLTHSETWWWDSSCRPRYIQTPI